MSNFSLPTRALLLAASAFPLLAQAPQFAAPVRLMAGDTMLGADRLYPSPVLHDVDGDGQPDLVVGDLRGWLTVARRTDATKFAAETPLHAADGARLDFGNW